MTRRRLEDGLQKAVCELLDIYERQKKLRYHAVPNGGKRSKIEAAIMKLMGTRKGVPDLCVLIWRGPTIWIELKTDTGKLSPAQSEWLEWINNSAGFRASFVCRSTDDVQRVIKWALTQQADMRLTKFVSGVEHTTL